MSRHHRVLFGCACFAAGLVPALLSAQALAQSAPASNDMANMPGMSMGSAPAASASVPASAASVSAAMPVPSPPSPRTSTDKGDDAMSGMPMGSMGSMTAGRGSTTVPGSVNTAALAPMGSMQMDDDPVFAKVLIDQLEGFSARHVSGQSWEASGWIGNDNNKLWARTEGERDDGRLNDGDLELLWDHTANAYWDTQLGLRQDFGVGPSRQWAAFGVQGLAPYWFDLEATGYLSESGRTAARLRAEYELLFTQRLILQPETEINLYGKSDPARRLGSGVSDVQLGLRLRYEIRRQIAPYIGVNWVRRLGGTANAARQDHRPVLDAQVVAGIRLWF